MHILSSIRSQSKRVSTIVPSLALLCCAHSLYAEDSGTGADAEIIVITAQKKETKLSRVTGSLQLIDFKELSNKGYAPQLTENLKGLRGVFTYNTGGLSGVSSIRLRGASSSGTQIIKDGVPFNDPSTTQGSPNMSMSSDAGLKSIEVAMGPQSTLYGSKAIGGLIHLVPLAATGEATGNIRISLASFNTRQTNMQATGPISDKIGYAIGYSSVDSDGVSVQTNNKNGDPDPHEKDAYSKRGIYLRADFRPIEGLTVSLIRDESDGSTEFDGFLNPDDTSPFTDISTVKNQINADFETSDIFMTKVRAALSSYDRDTPNANFGNKGFSGDETFISMANFYAFAESMTASIGYDFRKEELTLDPVFPSPSASQDVTHQGLWVQGSYSSDGLEADISVRNESNSKSESANIWHAGAAIFLMDEALKINISAGTAFRTASLFELNYNLTDATNLKPEESLGMEFGAQYFYEDRASVGVTLWKTDYTRRIIYTGTWPNDFYANDSEEAYVTGVDVFGDYVMNESHLTFSANATFQNPKEGTALESRLPETQINARVTWSPEEKIWASFEVQYTGTRKPSSFASIPDDLEAYTLVNMSFGHRLSESVLLDLQIVNLLDESYTPLRDYSGMPRQVSLGFSAEF